MEEGKEEGDVEVKGKEDCEVREAKKTEEGKIWQKETTR